MRTTSANLGAKVIGILLTLDLVPRQCSVFLPQLEIGINLSLMFKVVGNRCVDLLQRKRGETVLNLLRGSSLLKRSHERVQRNTRTCYPYRAISLLNERNCLREGKLLHGNDHTPA